MTKTERGTREFREDREAIARALGSTTPHDASLDGTFAPQSLLALAQRFNRRLRSSGGRRTDPDWTLSRRIPLKASTWESLQRIAEILATEGQLVAPGQLAAVLLEDQIAQLYELDQAALRARRTSRAARSISNSKEQLT